MLRHGVIYEDSASTWTTRHRAWLRAQDLGGGAQTALCDYIGAIDALELRRGDLERAIAALLPVSPYAQTAARLRCLRGIDTLSAAGLCAEIGDFERFARPGRPMSYVAENTSGDKRRRGAITKSGSPHARRLLVEAAWHYRKTPSKGVTLKRRQAGHPAAVIAISWQAQRRLHHVWKRVADERAKRRTIVAVACELAGFCWALARAD